MAKKDEARRAEMRRLIAEQERSGRSVRAFAEEKGVSAWSLYGWRSRLGVAGSLRGGRAAATVYTLVQSCRKAGVDPFVYLADVLTRVATHPAARVEELIPANWKRLFAPDATAGV